MPIETHLTPFWALARALEERGHEVGFYTSGGLRGQIEREGYRCFPFQEVDERHIDCSPAAPAAAKLGMLARRQVYQHLLLGAVCAQVRDLERIWSVWPPHAMVCDLTMWGPPLVVRETRRVPVAVFSHPAYCMLAGQDNPAPWLSLPRLRSAPARFLSRALAQGINLATTAIPRQASQIRAAYGLPPLTTTVMEFTGQMPLHLVASAPELDWDRVDLPPAVRYVGPCILEEGEDRPAPQWVTRLRGRRPRVVVLEETHYTEDPFLLRAAAAGLAGHSAEVVLVAGRGRDTQALEVDPCAPNVRVERWAPLRQALSSAAVVVAHGNSETVLAALSRGLPVVMVPRILEQPQVAWRLAATGAGIRLPVRGCTPQRLRHAVDRAPAFGRHAFRIGAALQRMGGAPRAAELVEGLLPARMRNVARSSGIAV